MTLISSSSLRRGYHTQCTTSPTIRYTSSCTLSNRATSRHSIRDIQSSSNHMINEISPPSLPSLPPLPPSLPSLPRHTTHIHTTHKPITTKPHNTEITPFLQKNIASIRQYAVTLPTYILTTRSSHLSVVLVVLFASSLLLTYSHSHRQNILGKTL